MFLRKSKLLPNNLDRTVITETAESDGRVEGASRADQAVPKRRTSMLLAWLACCLPMAAASAVTLAPHPRLILDSSTLSTLRKTAASNIPQWQVLKQQCDSMLGGTVQYPTGSTYPNLPNVGQGYQGSSYLPALLNEAMCYQVLKTSNPTAAAKYGAKGVDILMKMSAPYSTGSGNLGENPCTDDGYAIRFFGVGYGLGYDWLYELMTPTQRTQVYTTANNWITTWEKPGGCADFEYEHPQSNYYAGYFHAKAAIALATYDENPSAPAQWADWLGNQFGKRVQPYYAKHLLGGGWPEGYANYGPLAILNMTLPMREVKTATGSDLVNASAAYTFPIDSANFAMHFTWPSLTYFDDRDTNHSNSSTQPPGTPNTSISQQLFGELNYWKSPLANVFNQYRFAISAANAHFSMGDPWMVFLEVTPGAPVAPLSTLPLSYLAQGMGAVAARSNWTAGASWMSFRAAPYANNPAQGEEYFDQGSLALVRGGTPLLLNATGWAVHNPGGTAAENDVYSDNYGTFNSNNDALGNRRPYNVFYVRNMKGSALAEQYGQAAYTTESQGVRTRVTAYEDAPDHVFVQARWLNDMYRKFSAGPSVAGWTRQIIYLRPSRFVVYDRTSIGKSSYDQFMAWHFPALPVASSPGAGTTRLDVTYNGTYAGAMTTVLPTNAKVNSLVLYPDLNPTKFWQTQVRSATTNVSQQWLTVFDLSPSASKVARATPVVVTLGGITGVQLAAADGNNVVVSSTGPANLTIAGSIGYSVGVMAARHVITDLAPNTGYTVSVSTSGSNRSIKISAGGSMKSSANGVLDFSVNSAGAVQASSPPTIVQR